MFLSIQRARATLLLYLKKCLSIWSFYTAVRFLWHSLGNYTTQIAFVDLSSIEAFYGSELPRLPHPPNRTSTLQFPDPSRHLYLTKKDEAVCKKEVKSTMLFVKVIYTTNTQYKDHQQKQCCWQCPVLIWVLQVLMHPACPEATSHSKCRKVAFLHSTLLESQWFCGTLPFPLPLVLKNGSFRQRRSTE